MSPISTHHGYQLGELELEVDSDSLGDVGHWPDQLVVVGEEVIVKPLGVRVTSVHLGAEQQQEQR